MTEEDRPGTGPSRRRLLGWAGAGSAAGLTAGALIGRAGGQADPDGPPERLRAADAVVSAGRLPQGLADPVPAFGAVLAFDLPEGSGERAARAAATGFLRRVAALARDAEQGGQRGASAAFGLGLTPANLQITPGVGAGLLRAAGLDRARPDAFVALPAFAGDRLRPELGAGDLMVQVGAEDPARLSAAIQQVGGAAAAAGLAVRWTRTGFRATSAASQDPAATGRNVMGHRDGTANTPVGSPLWESVTLVNDPASWMHRGSYLVVRQIRLDLDDWFGRPERERDAVIGRSTRTGAALGTTAETDPVDLELRDVDGVLRVPADAHIRLASPTNTLGARIHRRSWNFDDGWDPDGTRRAGLLFLAWQSDPRRGFIPIQESLAENDALNRFAEHVGSAIFAVPAQSPEEEYVGQRLLEA